MKTLKDRWPKLFGGINLNNFSNFFQVALAIAAIGLLPICINASEFREEYFIVMAVLLLLVAVGIVWWGRAIKKIQKK